MEPTSLFVWRRQPDEKVSSDSLSSGMVSSRDPAPTLLCTILRRLSNGSFTFATCPILSLSTKSLYVIVVELLFSFFLEPVSSFGIFLHFISTLLRR